MIPIEVGEKFHDWVVQNHHRDAREAVKWMDPYAIPEFYSVGKYEEVIVQLQDKIDKVWEAHRAVRPTGDWNPFENI